MSNVLWILIYGQIILGDTREYHHLPCRRNIRELLLSHILKFVSSSFLCNIYSSLLIGCPYRDKWSPFNFSVTGATVPLAEGSLLSNEYTCCTCSKPSKGILDIWIVHHDFQDLLRIFPSKLSALSISCQRSHSRMSVMWNRHFMACCHSHTIEPSVAFLFPQNLFLFQMMLLKFSILLYVFENRYSHAIILNPWWSWNYFKSTKIIFKINIDIILMFACYFCEE